MLFKKINKQKIIHECLCHLLKREMCIYALLGICLKNKLWRPNKLKYPKITGMEFFKKQN